MSVQKDQLREHDYDGIQEFDNPLPGWWLWLFWGTIIFSVIYVPYYHLFGLGPSPEKPTAWRWRRQLSFRQKNLLKFKLRKQPQEQAEIRCWGGKST